MAHNATFVPARYEIVVEGQLDPLWCAWFDGLSLETCPDGLTHLSGCLPDQTALRAVINQLFDLNLPLISVQRCDK